EEATRAREQPAGGNLAGAVRGAFEIEGSVGARGRSSARDGFRSRARRPSDQCRAAGGSRRLLRGAGCDRLLGARRRVGEARYLLAHVVVADRPPAPLFAAAPGPPARPPPPSPPRRPPS